MFRWIFGVLRLRQGLLRGACGLRMENTGLGFWNDGISPYCIDPMKEMQCSTVRRRVGGAYHLTESLVQNRATWRTVHLVTGYGADIQGRTLIRV
jgi:hypothetical protein